MILFFKLKWEAIFFNFSAMSRLFTAVLIGRLFLDKFRRKRWDGCTRMNGFGFGTDGSGSEITVISISLSESISWTGCCSSRSSIVFGGSFTAELSLITSISSSLWTSTCTLGKLSVSLFDKTWDIGDWRSGSLSCSDVFCGSNGSISLWERMRSIFKVLWEFCVSDLWTVCKKKASSLYSYLKLGNRIVTFMCRFSE